jgi:hypothetical protein
MDEEAEEAYEAEADYFEEDEEYEEEIEEEEEEEEEVGSEYESELEEEEKKAKFHPVIQKINELDKNHRIIRVRAPENYLSSHIIQFSEMVEAIGIRISQIEMGAPVFTDVSGYTSVIDMAKKEFIDRQNPFLLVREMRVGEAEVEVEEWKVREMSFPIIDKEILALTEKQITELLKK